MYNSHQCPCCASENVDENASVVAPFIQGYVLQTPPAESPLCTLRFCRTCGFAFFKERFTEAEANKLYSEYRSENYFRERHKHEFWYTHQINSAAGETPETRRQMFNQFAADAVGHFKTDSRVLDYGGDRGQYISDVFEEAEKYVFEISDQLPAAGVSKIASLPELKGRTFDFVYFCHTLEHLSDPHEALTGLKDLVVPGGLLYIEVPLEYPKFVVKQNNRIYRAYLRALNRNRRFFSFFDALSLYVRLKLDKPLPPFCFVKLHEHINFFNLGSLKALLLRSGYDVVKLSEMKFHFETGRTKMIQCLARRR
jgi:SAM-dependent methyltransferase